MIPLACPDIGEEEVALVNRVLRSDFLSMGRMTQDFERAVADSVGAPHAVAVSSGTAGLHTLIRALGIGPGDEVVTTSFSFVATANAVLYEGARPVFADISPEDYGLDPEAVRAAITPRTRAILAVDVFGRPCRLEDLRELAEGHGLLLIDDACEALGSQVLRAGGTGSQPEWLPVGNPGLSDAAVFAFFPNKQVTTGEGGMIVTGSDELAGLCRSLRNQGRGEGERWLVHERLGFNYRMDEMSAAVGLGQMRRLEELKAKRARVARLYHERLSGLEDLAVPREGLDYRVNWFVYVVRLAPDIDRDKVMEHLAGQGIPARPYFQPIHLQPFFRESFGHRPGRLPETEAAGRSCLALPFHGRLTEGDVETVGNRLEEAMAASRPPRVAAVPAPAARRAPRPSTTVLDVDDERWDEELDRFPAVDVYYERGYLKACALAEDSPARPLLFAFRQGGASVICPFLFRPLGRGLAGPSGRLFDAIGPYGYAGPLSRGASREVLVRSAREFDAYCRASRVVASFTRFHPLLENQHTWEPYLRPEPVRQTVCIDLDPREGIFGNMTPECRGRVRKAWKAGLTFEIRGWEEGGEEFLSLYRETMDRVGASDWFRFPARYYSTLAAGLAERPLVAEARRDGVVQATVLVLRRRPFIHYHLAASGRDRSDAPMNFLIYSLAELSSSWGYTRLHLGGGFAGNDSLFRFKGSFNRRGRRPFSVGKWVHLADAYAEVCSRAGRATPGGFFPAYRSGR